VATPASPVKSYEEQHRRAADTLNRLSQLSTSQIQQLREACRLEPANAGYAGLLSQWAGAEQPAPDQGKTNDRP
jgi:hypothetical protein